jgi:hypothetical protein
LALGIETRATKSGTGPASHVVDVIVGVAFVPADDAAWVKPIRLGTFVPREKRRDGAAHEVVVGRVGSVRKLEAVEASVVSINVRLDVNCFSGSHVQGAALAEPIEGHAWDGWPLGWVVPVSAGVHCEALAVGLTLLWPVLKDTMGTAEILHAARYAVCTANDSITESVLPHGSRVASGSADADDIGVCVDRGERSKGNDSGGNLDHGWTGDEKVN